MNQDSLNRWLTLVANVGVIAGLVFVGIQLKQDRDLAAAAVLQDSIDTTMHFAELVGQHPKVWHGGLSGAALEPHEARFFNSTAIAYNTWHYSNYVNAGELGLAEPGRFIEEWAHNLHENPGLKKWWLSRHSGPTGEPFNDAVLEELEILENQ